jgi:oligopeptide transport system substrate-binding protein
MRSRMLVLGLLTVVMGLLVVLGMVAGASGSGDGGGGAPSAPEQVALRIGVGDGLLVLDPALADDPASQLVVEQLFIGLIDLDDETGEIRPELATTWTVSADHTAYTFTLRNDAYWSDENPVTAADVEYGILYALAPTNTSGYAGVLAQYIENGEDFHDGTLTDPNQVGVTALNPTTVRIRTAEPGAAKLTILSMWMARPLPQWAIEAPGVVTWTLPGNIVTSGPYHLTEWDDAHLVMEKSLTYYNAAEVQIERIEGVMVDEETAWQMYKYGMLDTVQVPTDAFLHAGLMSQVRTVATQAAFANLFSVQQEPFDDPLVRKAFMAAVDRQGMLDVTSVRGFPALTFTAPTIFGYVDGAAEGIGIPYNPGQAQTWLTQAGYPAGVGLPPITYTTFSQTTWINLGQYMVDSWYTNLGVSVTLRPVLPELMEAVCGDGVCQISRAGWAPDYNEAYSYLHDAVENVDGRMGYWTNAGYDLLLTQAAAEENPTARRDLYRQAEEILVETDPPLMPLFHATSRVASRPYLQRTYSNWPVDMAGWRIAREVYLPVAMRAYAPLTNGGFEDGWAGWSHGGSLPQAIVSEDWHTGASAARLGNPTYDCEGGVPVGSAWLERTISVPSSGVSSLRVYYRIVSEDLFDNEKYDRFEILVNGAVRLRDGNVELPYGCAPDPHVGPWKSFSVDVTGYSGQNITLRLQNVTADTWFNTWTYVDDIEFVP